MSSVEEQETAGRGQGQHPGADRSPEEAAFEPRLTGWRRRTALGLATVGGAGLAPVAPGTFGAAVGVGLHVLCAPLGALAWILLLLLVHGLGVWASTEAERLFGQHDDGRIVIDEVAGQLVALAPLLIVLPAERWRAPLPLLAGFVAFRFFDIAKPGPVRWAERRFPAGLGVMADDVVAGLLAAGILALTLGTGVIG